MPRPDPKTKPASMDHKAIPSVAGCTTGSLCPRCPYRRDEVRSLYSKPSFCLWLGIVTGMSSRFCTPAHFVPQSTDHSGCQSVRWGRWPENAGYCLRLYGVSFQRLAAYSPGLVCPYRQVRRFAQWLPEASIRRTSENAVKRKFNFRLVLLWSGAWRSAAAKLLGCR
jgi:hypothetical protein